MYALLGKRLALLDAKTVLFIRDDQAQIVKINIVLQQRLCPDNDIAGAKDDPFLRPALLLCRQRTGQQDRFKRQSIRFGQFCDRLIVLFGEHLRRCHKCSLMMVHHAHKHRKDRHDRLAGTDIALDQPVHEMGRTQILLDLSPYLFLCIRELIGKLVDQILAGIDPHHRRIIDLLCRHVLQKQDGHDKEQKFFEYNPLPAGKHRLPVGREMNS